ncbi:MAG: hypothetical protein ABI047_08210 [Jatrophihabitantaceae bacterium]
MNDAALATTWIGVIAVVGAVIAILVLARSWAVEELLSRVD